MAGDRVQIATGSSRSGGKPSRNLERVGVRESVCAMTLTGLSVDWDSVTCAVRATSD
jgi:hypothetical protein